jgi:signal transduction histidine kinase
MGLLVFAPLRVLPLVVTVAFLAVLHGPTPVTATDWILGVAAAVLTGAGAWIPLTATVTQCALLAVGLYDSTRTVMPMLFLLTMISLGELWVRRDGWPCWVGTAAFVLAQTVLVAPHFDPVLSTAGIVISTVPTVGLAVFIRSVLRRAITAERDRERSVWQARATERTAIARELHDLVAHHMASIAVQVGAARQTLGGTPAPVDEALAQAHATSRAALADLKRLMAVLRDPSMMSDDAGTAMAEPAGLTTALDTAVAVARATGVTVDSDIDASVTGLDSIRRLAVLRVVQEGLTNVVKHAGPTACAALTVRVTGPAVHIRVADNGTGAPKGQPGFGLVGMRERVELLGGAVRTRPGRPGWTLEVDIP